MLRITGSWFFSTTTTTTCTAAISHVITWDLYTFVFVPFAVPFCYAAMTLLFLPFPASLHLPRTYTPGSPCAFRFLVPLRWIRRFFTRSLRYLYLTGSFVAGSRYLAPFFYRSVVLPAFYGSSSFHLFPYAFHGCAHHHAGLLYAHSTQFYQVRSFWFSPIPPTTG